MRILAGALTAFLLLPSGAVQAQFLTQDLTRAVVAGRPFQLAFSGVLNPDCSPTGRTTIRVAQAPAHGIVRIRQIVDVVKYPPGHRLSGCNGRRVNSAAAYLTATPGYVGADSVALEIIYPSGGLRRMNFSLTVR
jgi:hypothetical protein